MIKKLIELYKMYKNKRQLKARLKEIRERDPFIYD